MAHSSKKQTSKDKDIVEKVKEVLGEVKQFLIREFTDSTGYVHVNVEQPRENERMTLVEAEDKEKAKMKVSEQND